MEGAPGTGSLALVFLQRVDCGRYGGPGYQAS